MNVGFFNKVQLAQHHGCCCWRNTNQIWLAQVKVSTSLHNDLNLMVWTEPSSSSEPPTTTELRTALCVVSHPAAKTRRCRGNSLIRQLWIKRGHAISVCLAVSLGGCVGTAAVIWIWGARRKKNPLWSNNLHADGFLHPGWKKITFTIIVEQVQRLRCQTCLFQSPTVLFHYANSTEIEPNVFEQSPNLVFFFFIVMWDKTPQKRLKNTVLPS